PGPGPARLAASDVLPVTVMVKILSAIFAYYKHSSEKVVIASGCSGGLQPWLCAPAPPATIVPGRGTARRGPRAAPVRRRRRRGLPLARAAAVAAARPCRSSAESPATPRE